MKLNKANNFEIAKTGIDTFKAWNITFTQTNMLDTFLNVNCKQIFAKYQWIVLSLWFWHLVEIWWKIGLHRQHVSAAYLASSLEWVF